MYDTPTDLLAIARTAPARIGKLNYPCRVRQQGRDRECQSTDGVVGVGVGVDWRPSTDAARELRIRTLIQERIQAILKERFPHVMRTNGTMTSRWLLVPQLAHFRLDASRNGTWVFTPRRYEYSAGDILCSPSRGMEAWEAMFAWRDDYRAQSADESLVPCGGARHDGGD